LTSAFGVDWSNSLSSNTRARFIAPVFARLRGVPLQLSLTPGGIYLAGTSLVTVGASQYFQRMLLAGIAARTQFVLAARDDGIPPPTKRPIALPWDYNRVAIARWGFGGGEVWAQEKPRVDPNDAEKLKPDETSDNPMHRSAFRWAPKVDPKTDPPDPTDVDLGGDPWSGLGEGSFDTPFSIPKNETVGRRCCVKAVVLKRWRPDNRKVQNIDLDGETHKEMWQRFWKFEIDATFVNEDQEVPETAGCDCSCCSYRQFLKGHTYSIPPGKKPIGIREPGFVQDSNPPYRPYGHRHYPDPGHDGDRYDQPDRKTGCHYHMRDEPSTMGLPGWTYEFDKIFWGRIYDTCQNRAVRAQLKWKLGKETGKFPPL
ncbi:MAG: hypothetical protein AB7T63_17095, partial [Planctomycetota bacterium]